MQKYFGYLYLLLLFAAFLYIQPFLLQTHTKSIWKSLPLISISLVSVQSLNMLLISSCSMLDTVEPFSIVLKCMCVLLGFKKKARLFQESKLDFDREKQMVDYTPLRFNLLMRKNADRKIIELYFNGHFMKNIKH